MNNKQVEKIGGIISISKKAQKLIMGFDVIKIAASDRKINHIITASDLSDKSVKEVNYLCDKYSIKNIRVEVTLDEFWFYLGKRTGILSILDKGLFNKLMEVIADDKKD